jgi:hypothetical protein
VEDVEALVAVVAGISTVAVVKEECEGVAPSTSSVRTVMEPIMVAKIVAPVSPNRCARFASKLDTLQIGAGTGLKKTLFLKKGMPAQP